MTKSFENGSTTRTCADCATPCRSPKSHSWEGRYEIIAVHKQDVLRALGPIPSGVEDEVRKLMFFDEVTVNTTHDYEKDAVCVDDVLYFVQMTELTLADAVVRNDYQTVPGLYEGALERAGEVHDRLSATIAERESAGNKRWWICISG